MTLLIALPLVFMAGIAITKRSFTAMDRMVGSAPLCSANDDDLVRPEILGRPLSGRTDA
jgi:hypothetical protein